MKIAFLGGGNMARALIAGLLAKGHAAGDLSVIELRREAHDELRSRYGVQVSSAPDAHTQAADILVLAVKPQDLRASLLPLAGLARDKLVLSVAAGVHLADIARWLGGHARLVRAMPNMPALIGEGISVLCAAPLLEAAQRARAEGVLAAVGETLWIENERLLDAVTALSGSGPAYLFWFIEQLAAGGAALGLAPEMAARLALKTVLGSAQLAAQSSESAAALRERVTSRGGTTEAALRVFDEERLAERLHRALEAASRRGAELGSQLGRD